MQCLLFCGCLVGGAAQAEEDYAVPEDSESPVLRAGGVDIYPGFSLVEKRNDNLFKSDIGKKASLITVVSPSVLMQAKSGANIYSLAYDADLARYAQSTPDNYDDQNLSANAELAFSSRTTLTLTPQIKVGHDDRGSTYSLPTATPNRWDNTGLAGSFTYGSEDSIGRIQLDADAYSIRYRNNRAVTSTLDRDVSDVGGTFYYRTSPKIYALVQLTETRISYADPAATLSGKEQRILLGATWKATAQTSGSFKIGQLRKKFDSAARTGFSGTSWEGSVRWSPREFAYIDWITGRKSTESTGVGDFVLLTSNALDLGYDLSERTSLHLNVARLVEDFSLSGRSDSTQSYGVKAEYKLRKWLVLGAEYSHAAKTSTGFTGVSPNYTGNIIAVSIRTEL
ncbi:MAG TPA: outer membrane beta-barrel protein [Gallionella sp.]|nr:outer membrane beta-barrel protein [Gallionella sp.]